MKNTARRLLAALLTLVLATTTFTFPVFAEDGDPQDQNADKAKRTIMLYDCGSDLENDIGLATYNLRQILESHFSSDDDINFIVMTGGCNQWHLDNDEVPDNDNKCLVFPEGVNVPDDAVVMEDPEDWENLIPLPSKSQISGVYNQIWEARGIDAKIGDKDDPNAGRMVLLDGDGITGEGVKSEDELMSDPNVLKQFINFGVDNYPAEKYDLILWDHGGGPAGGFGVDQHAGNVMSFAGLVDAFSDNKVTKDGGKFDFIDFDACLMGNLELALVLSDYTDYYIASAELEPGYGQYYGPKAAKDGQEYTGWLDELGDPANDDKYNAPGGTFELGKVIVDDFHKFYEKAEGDGYSQEGTLAVFDTKKMVDSGLLDAVSALCGVLIREAMDPHVGDPLKMEGIAFYDELMAFSNSIEYGDSELFDLGNAAAFLGVVNSEVSEKNLEDGDFVDYNEYKDIAESVINLLQGTDPNKTFMYMKGTSGIRSADQYHRTADGKLDLGSLPSSGLSIYVPRNDMAFTAVSYSEELDPIIEKLPNDKRRGLLEDIETVAALYNLIFCSGTTIDNMIRNDLEDFGITSKDQINYDRVIDVMKNSEYFGIWDHIVQKDVEKIRKQEPGFDVEEWLRILIPQQIKDAVDPGRIKAVKIRNKNGESYRITINDTRKRIIKSIERQVIAELPVFERYLETMDPDDSMMAREGIISLGSMTGKLHNDLPDDASLEDRIRWFNENSAVWDIEDQDLQWYGLNDADGAFHVASIHHIDKDGIYVPVLNMSASGTEAERYILMEFSNEENNGKHKLLSFYYMSPDMGGVQVIPKDLTGSIKLMPIMYVRQFFGGSFYIPISEKEFTLTADNADDVTLDLTDVDNIPDIADSDNDGYKFSSAFTITDIYNRRIDITNEVKDAPVDISNFEVTMKAEYPYTGKAIKPDVKVSGLDQSCYTVAYSNNTKVGTATVTITAKGDKYTGTITKTFRIVKASNPLKVKGKKVAIRFKKLKKKSQTLKAGKTIKTLKAGQGKMTYKLVSAKKGKKNFKKKFRINSKNGKLTVKKGLKKGTYKVTIKVRAAGNNCYNRSSWKKLTTRIVVR